MNKKELSYLCKDCLFGNLYFFNFLFILNIILLYYFKNLFLEASLIILFILNLILLIKKIREVKHGSRS